MHCREASLWLSGLMGGNDPQNAKTALRGYALCGEPRAGTTFFRDLLKSTDVLGNPVEWFNPSWKASIPKGEDFFATMLKRATTPNGIYAMKMFSGHRFQGQKHRWVTRLPNLSFVHIRRDDLLGQAISLARALQTRSFVHTVPESRKAAYNRRKIDSALLSIATGQARWEMWFARHEITPLRLVYEDFQEDPESAVQAIADLVGVKGAKIDRSTITRQIQRDQLSDEWRQRYIAEAPSRDILPSLLEFAPKKTISMLRNRFR